VTAPGEGEWSGGGLKIDRVGRTFSAGAVYFVRQGSKPRQSLARGLAFSAGHPPASFPVITRLDRVIHFILDPLVKPEDDQRNARRVTGGAYIKATLPAQIDLPPCTFQGF